MELKTLRTACEQCDNTKDTKDQEGGADGGGALSDVSSVADSHELSPNRFAIKNEFLRGNTTSKSTKCTNCPASDELCVTFVGIKCQHIPKCYKAHKIPNRMNIRYCSDFLMPDQFCPGHCGDPHIKFERLKLIYQEEVQIMYKSCAICCNSSSNIDSRSSHRSISQTPSEESSHSAKNNNFGMGKKSPVPPLTNRRIVAYESDEEEGNYHELTQHESSSQRSSSPQSSSSKDGLGGTRTRDTKITRDKFTRTCKFYQHGGCSLGNSCPYIHARSSERK